MMDVFIKELGYYLPETVLSNEQIAAEFPEWTAQSIFDKVGIKNRRRAGDGETASDMAVKAAEELFRRVPNLKSTIDFVLFCTQSPDYKLPTSACIIQHRLGLSETCGALDFNLGCSGYVYGLALAKSLVSCGMAKNVLLFTGETYSKYIGKDDKGNISLFGDAATATVVSTDGFVKIGNFVFGTDGSGFEKLIVRTGGARNLVQENGKSDRLFMDGTGIFSFTLKQIPPLVEAVLAKNELRKDGVDLFVFHQANAFMLEHLRKKLSIPEEKFFVCLENIGNTVSNSIAIALFEARKKHTFKSGTKILAAGFGVGLSWAGCTLEAV